MPPTLEDALAAIRARRRLVLLLRGAAEALSVLGLGLIALAAVDALAHPSPSHRWLLSLVLDGAAACVLVLRGLVPALRPPATVALAREAERAAGGLDELISSAVQLAHAPDAGISSWMVARTGVLAAQSLRRHQPSRLVPSRPARRAAIQAGAVLLAVAALAVAPGMRVLLLRASWPGLSLERPARTMLQVHPGNITAVSGESLAISAEARPLPDEAEVRLRWDDGLDQRLPMAIAQGELACSIPPATRGFTYQVLAGDAESPSYHVRLVEPPRVRAVRLRISPPAYTGQPAREQEGGDVAVIAGSTVEIECAIAGGTVEAATLEGDGASAAASVVRAADGGQLVRARLLARQDRAWWWRLTGENGVAGEIPERWHLTCVPDAPPTVQLEGPAAGHRQAARDGRLALSVVAGDDLGLRDLALIITTPAGRERRSLALQPLARQAQVQVMLHLEDWQLAEGDGLTLQAEAVDCGGQSTSSAPVVVTVVSPAGAGAGERAALMAGLAPRLGEMAVQLAAQSRAWSALARAANGDDPATRRTELALILDRSAAAARTGSEVAAALDGLDDGPASRDAHRLGWGLDAWSCGVHEQQAQVVADAGRDRLQLAVGAAQADAATIDCDRLRHALALIGAASEAEALEAEAGALAGALERSLQAGRRDEAWAGTASIQGGLWGRFYAGIDCSGTVYAEEVAVPAIANRDVPGVGTTQFSAQWCGEIEVPQDGDWVFTADADDGVAWEIDGHQLFDPSAWSMHAPTRYSGTIHLLAGWHPTRLRYMQGGGGSTLAINGAPAGQQPVPIPLERLRCTVQSCDRAALLASDPAAAAAEHARVAGELAQLAGISERLGQLSRSDLAQPDAATAGLAAQLRDAAAASPAPAASQLLALAGQVQQQGTTAREALLQGLAAGAVGVASRELAEPLQALARIHDRLAELALLPHDLPEEDARQARWRALAAMQGWSAQLRRELPRCRWRLLAQCRSPSEDPRALREVVAASRILGRAGARPEVPAPPDGAAEGPAPPSQAARLQLLDELLAKAGKALDAARGLRLDAAGATARAHLEALIALRGYRPLAAADERWALARDCQSQLPLLARDEPAVALLRSCAGPDAIDADAAADAISAWPPPPAAAGSQAQAIVAGLEHAAEAFATACAPPSLLSSEATAAAHLEAAEAGLAITGEVVASHPGMPRRPQACLAVALDCERFARTGLLPERLAELAARASAALLEDGEDAPAAPGLAEAGAARHAGEVLSAAATDPARRTEARGLLAQLAAGAGVGVGAIPGAGAPATAQLLAVVADRSAEVDARLRFAHAAQELVAAASSLSQHAGSTPAVPAGVLAAANAALRSARDLEAAVGAGEAEELAARAHLLAGSLIREVLTPLAGLVAAAPAAPALRELGRESAALAQSAAAGADLLDQARRRHLQLLGRAITAASGAGHAPAPPELEAALAAADQADAQARSALELATAQAQALQGPADTPAARVAAATAQGAALQALAGVQAAAGTAASVAVQADAAVHADGALSAATGLHLLAAAGSRELAVQALAASAAAAGENTAVAAGQAAGAEAAAEARALAATAPSGHGASPGAGAGVPEPSAVAAAAATASTLLAAAPAREQAYAQAGQLLLRAAGAAMAASASGSAPSAAESGGAPGDASGVGPSATPAVGDAALAERLGQASGPSSGDWVRPAAGGSSQVEVRNDGIERFDAEQQAEIRAYFRRLASAP